MGKNQYSVQNKEAKDDKETFHGSCSPALIYGSLLLKGTKLKQQTYNNWTKRWASNNDSLLFECDLTFYPPIRPSQ